MNKSIIAGRKSSKREISQQENLFYEEDQQDAGFLH